MNDTPRVAAIVAVIVAEMERAVALDNQGNGTIAALQMAIEIWRKMLTALSPAQPTKNETFSDEEWVAFFIAAKEELARARRNDDDTAALRWEQALTKLRRLSQAGPLPASGTDAALSTQKDPDHSGPPVVAQPLCRSADRERRDGTAAQTSGRRVQAEGVTAGETAVPVNDDAIPEYLAVAYEMLDSARSSAPVPASICKARASASDPPQECDWPFCGCDPVADKVLDAIRESGRFVLVSSGGW
jgi:hypothetical protein